MRNALRSGVTSLLVTYATVPRVRTFLLNQRIVDVPNHRSSHSGAVARGGGLACAVGAAAGLASVRMGPDMPRRLILAVGAVTAVGLSDDILGNVPVPLRLVTQLISSTCWAPSVTTAVLGMIPASGLINVVNFMDGVNGITGMTGIVWGLSTAITGNQLGDPALEAIGAVTAGAGAGFLPWNLREAHIFLGDVGSYFFGALMAASILRVSDRPRTAWRVAAPLLPYGLDAAQAVARRLVRGENIGEAHREHAYQRIVDHWGATHTQVALIHAGAATISRSLAQFDNTIARVLAPSAVAMVYAFLPDLFVALRRGVRR